MIITLLLGFVVAVVGLTLSIFPTITKIPNVLGYDIDTALVSGIGSLNSFLDTFWPIKIMITGFLYLLGYYSLKIALKFIFGHRSPHN